MRPSFKLAGMFVLFITWGMALSACQTLPSHEMASKPARLLPVYAVTTRALDTNEGHVFSGERDASAHMMRHEVSLPPARVEGVVNIASTEAESKRDEHFMLHATQGPMSTDAFTRRIMNERGKRRVVLFIHGYNNTYRDALYRMAQVYDDAGLTDLPVLFSFASRGKVLDYGYDEDSASMARPALAHIIEKLMIATNGQLDIVAHSMGNWLAVEALKEVALKHPHTKPRIGTLILASPDIDADVFSTQWPRIAPLSHETILVCNPNDKALKASTRVGGEKPRLGNLDPCVQTAQQRFKGLKVIDASPFDGESRDRLRHNPGANSALIERFALHMKKGNQLTKPNAGNAIENLEASTAGLFDGVIGILPRAIGQGSAPR